jgi:hypothetical protein
MKTMRGFSLAIVSSLIAVACAGKAPPPANLAATPPRAAAPAPVYDVPALSTFSVALLNPVGTRLSAPGDSFRAKVLSPLTTLRGYTLVPVGSVLKGRVVAVDQAPASRLRLKFETVTTTAGPVPVYATLADVQPNPSFVVRQSRRTDGDYDVTLDGVPAVPVGGRGELSVAAAHSDIRLATKTQLQIVLVHPLRVGRN